MNKIDVKLLTNELLSYCHEYYDLDSPSISDVEYDYKLEELRKAEEETGFCLTNSPTHKVQGEILPFLKKVKHSVPMLSADKSTNIEDVKKFIGNHDVTVSYKLDGGTVVVKYQGGQFIQAISRGSGEEGEDITHTAKMIKNLPMTIPYKGYLEVRGEALIPWKYYDEMNKDGSLGHPRNVATGGLRQLDANEAAKRNIYFYAFTLVNWKDTDVKTKSHSLEFLSQLGFDVVPYYVYPIDGTLEECIQSLNRKCYKNPTDGWCFEFNDLIYGESLGSTGHHDRKLFALKPDIETYETTLKSIEFTMGKTGILTPTAVFEPTEIDNTIVERASVHNISVMKSLNMSINATIEIYKANLIIPQVLRTVCDGNFPIEIPKYCPVCGAETSIVKDNNTENLICTNPNCSGKLLGKLVHAVSKKALNVDGLSEATLQMLINMHWIHNISDIYKLRHYQTEWERCEGFGVQSVGNILSAIEKSRNITLNCFIDALSIPGVGSSAAKTISKAFHGDYNEFNLALMNNFYFASLTDIGMVTANNITKYYTKNKSEIAELASELRFMVEEKNEVKDNPMKDKHFCITGSFSQSRDVLKRKLEDLGGIFVSGVSKKLDILFVGDKAGSKLDKAKTLGIKIADESELINIIGG